MTLEKLIALHGTKGDFDRFATSAENLSMMLSQAEGVFFLLSRLHDDHNYDGHTGLQAVADLCGVALASVGKTDDLVVENLISRLRRAMVQKEAVE